MKLIRWLLKFIWLLLRFFIGLIIFVALIQFLCAPVYDFPKKEIFSGDKFYNPYEKCDSGWWKKSVFHKHADGWGGINFKKNNTQATFDRYKYLGYDIVALSDYQHINPAKFEKQEEHIPNYEHGFGMKKNHHLSIGARSVLPFDFIFPQTVSNKQFIINLLRPRTEVMVLAHPDWYSAVTDYDVKRLCNYDCFEIFSNYHNSVNIWDSALSAGMPVFLVADDDNDEMDNPNVMGRCMTLVNAEKSTLGLVADALKKGRTIGVRVHSLENESWEEKKRNIDAIPMLRSFSVKGDTIKVSVSDTASVVSFIGQNGLIEKTDSNTLEAFYQIKHSDTYVRTHIVFKNGTQFFLNPVIRYKGEGIITYHPKVDVWITVLKNLIFAGIVIMLVYFYRRRKKRNK